MDSGEVISRIKRIEDEATEQLSHLSMAYDVYLSGEDVDAIREARNAFERQVPKKPIKIPDPYCDFIIGYYCPNPQCRCYFGQRGKRNVILFQKSKYCDCGQAIDWKEEDI